jgi:hypothetical protein
MLEVCRRAVLEQGRYVFFDEMIALLETAGFEVSDVFRDFDRNPFDGTGEMIVVAQRTKS